MAEPSGSIDQTDTLKADGIYVRFGGLAAVQDVSMSLRRHEILGLIGPNGAGKTTLVNALTGFQRPSAGTVFLGDLDVTGWAPHRLGRIGLARTFQAVRLFRGMQVVENIEVSAVGSGLDRRRASRRAWDILRWLKFEHKANVLAGTLPYGEERRVGIGRALALSPRFVLLDEPAAGLGDTECDELMELISRIPREFGCGVLLIEHNMRVIMGACHRIHVINSGRTIAEDSPDEIQQNPDVIRAYLGSKSHSRMGEARA
jgi:branched-chain amino acid transport system ATP-binding protein